MPNLCGKVFPVLDKGFIRLVDYMGSDERIAEAARVSYARDTTKLRSDHQLIDYLLRNRHTSPFEQCVMTFHIKLPIFIARQWVRHRTARINEISARYSVLSEDSYYPQPEVITTQDKKNRQGRSQEPLSPENRKEVMDLIDHCYSQTYAAYQKILDTSTAHELARIVLPVGTYTEWYWQIDLHNLFHFLSLRLAPQAQYEITEYAKILLDIITELFPVATQSFREHILHAQDFSFTESQALQKLAKKYPTQLQKIAEEAGMEEKRLKRFMEKLKINDD